MGPRVQWGLREEELKGLMGAKEEGCFQRERGASQKEEGVLERGWGAKGWKGVEASMLVCRIELLFQDPDSGKAGVALWFLNGSLFSTSLGAPS